MFSIQKQKNFVLNPLRILRMGQFDLKKVWPFDVLPKQTMKELQVQVWTSTTMNNDFMVNKEGTKFM